MAYRWRPNKTQRKEFAQNMQDPEYAEAYYKRQDARAEKRRAGSKFNYESAGGMYIPTKEQYLFAISNPDLFKGGDEESARNEVIYGFSTNEKVHHDYIHVVNEIIRKQYGKY